MKTIDIVSTIPPTYLCEASENSGVTVMVEASQDMLNKEFQCKREKYTLPQLVFAKVAGSSTGKLKTIGD